MPRWLGLALGLAVWAWVLWAPPAAAAAGDAPPATPGPAAVAADAIDPTPAFEAWAALAPEHFARARARARRFVAEYAAAGPDPTPVVVRRLFGLRGGVLEDLHALRMRLPNDLDAEAAMAAAIAEADDALMACIDDVRTRGGHPMLHPGPLDAWFYRGPERAANDLLA